MANNERSVFEGMVWALTPAALQLLREFQRIGMHHDLAIALMDEWIKLGIITEQEVYQNPEEI